MYDDEQKNEDSLQGAIFETPQAQPMSKKPKENQWLFLFGCLLVAAALVFNGYQLWRRTQLVNTPGQINSQQNVGALAEVISQDKDLYAFYEAYQNLIMNSTLEPAKANLIDGAIEGMLDRLDDQYATYYDHDIFTVKMDDRSGFYSGIGASVIENGGYITVVQPYENSPAKAAGLQTGDQILAVDGVDVVGWSTQDGIVLVRGEIGTDVVLKLRRPGSVEDFEVTITRALMETITVTGVLAENGIATITVSSFNDQTGKQVDKYVKQFLEQGMKGLILDLRSNGGGTHTGVVESARVLVPKGKIFSMVYANGYTDEESSDLIDRGFPMVTVVNQYSASASEVLAGALQDSGVPLIGVQTYGKGVGQNSSSLANGPGITFTTSNWYTRNGNSVAGVGLTPDSPVNDPTFPLGVIEIEKMKASDISLLQTKLSALGYVVQEEGFGTLTSEALTKYQAAIGVEANGLLNLRTVQQLNADCYDLPNAEADVQWDTALQVLLDLISD